jgi:two-component system nitrogen regulation sensor histidine kinase NtrY
MTSVDTSAVQLDPSLAEPKGLSLWRLLAPFAIGLALFSAFLTFVVLTGRPESSQRAKSPFPSC